MGMMAEATRAGADSALDQKLFLLFVRQFRKLSLANSSTLLECYLLKSLLDVRLSFVHARLRQKLVGLLNAGNSLMGKQLVPHLSIPILVDLAARRDFLS